MPAQYGVHTSKTLSTD